jgi:glycosyltransferase involved in cell wall biosynthesis
MRLVSICIPTFNGSKFIEEALESCRIQDYRNLELVISDDDSQDLTIEIIKRNTSNFPFPVRLIHHKPMGIGANWNNCIENASGKYIKFLFQDDILEPDCVSQLVQLIESRPNVGLVACKRNFLMESGLEEKYRDWLNRYENLQKTLKSNSEGFYILDKESFNYSFFYSGSRNKIGEPSTVLIRKECFDRLGKFREDLKQNLDFEYWWRIMTKYQILISPRTYVNFRIHENQASNINNGKSLPDYRITRLLILTKYIWKMRPTEGLKVLRKEFSIIKQAIINRIIKNLIQYGC